MPHVFVCYGDIWNEDERDYACGNLGGLNVRCDFKFENFLLQLYKLIGIDQNQHDFILKCLYNFGSKVTTYLIQNDHKLSFFLTGRDSCRPPTYLAINFKPPYNNNGIKNPSEKEKKKKF